MFYVYEIMKNQIKQWPSK